MARLIRSDNPNEKSERRGTRRRAWGRFKEGNRLNKIHQPLHRINPSNKKHSQLLIPLTILPLLTFLTPLTILTRPQRSDKASCESQFPVPADLQVCRAMQKCRAPQIPPLVEPPGRQLLPPLVAHRPGRRHSMRRPDDRHRPRPRPLRHAVQHRRPKAMKMKDDRSRGIHCPPGFIPFTDDRAVDALRLQRPVKLNTERVDAAGFCRIRAKVNDPQLF